MTVRIRFAPEYIDPILEGEKDVTIRVGEEWADLQAGTRVQLVDQDGDVFARATVSMVGTVTAGSAYGNVQEYDGHESYRSRGAFLSVLRRHYPYVEIDPETPVIEIHFKDVAEDSGYVERRRRNERRRRGDRRD